MSYYSKDKEKIQTIKDDYMSARKGVKILVELHEYKEAVVFARKIIKLTHPLDSGPDGMTKSWANQIYRSATSIAANISEGHGNGTDGKVVQFYRIARGSAFETLNWLMLAPQEIDVLELQKECQRVIGTLEKAIMELCEKRAVEFGIVLGEEA